jgi:hypothetical protein
VPNVSVVRNLKIMTMTKEIIVGVVYVWDGGNAGGQRIVVFTGCRRSYLASAYSSKRYRLLERALD